MPDGVTLSIAIVNWNAGRYLQDCLASIAANPPGCPFDIWLADNASTDGSIQKALADNPHVKSILNPGNPGFAAANNQIITACQGKYVLLLNPDTLARAGSIQKLVDYLEAHPKAGACGPRLVNPDGSLQESCYPFPTILREMWRLLHLDSLLPFGVYPVHRWDQETPRQVDALQGACLMLRKAAMDLVGCLDPGYFMYTEEIDLCHRLKTAGWESTWVPEAEVVHFGGKSTRHAADEMFLNLYRSKVRFFRQRYSRLDANLYKTVLGLASLLRIAFTLLAYLEKPPAQVRHLQLGRQYRMLVKALPGF